MKTLLFLLLSTAAFGQRCDSIRAVRNYLSFPSFNTLFNTGQCISGEISDTTICVKVPQNPARFQRMFASFSSPTGEPFSITSFEVYDTDCTFLGFGRDIPAGNDTLVVCYTIQTELIDNFCPYALLMTPLAVQWCGISCQTTQNGAMVVSWQTCTNSNTDRFEIALSTDAVNWQTVGIVPPVSVNTSTLQSYTVTLPSCLPGNNYVVVREVDLNGNVSVSDICHSFNPYPNAKFIRPYDLSGRVASGGQFNISK